MPVRNVFLTEHFDQFIASGIETGRYSNASEVVREALRLLEKQDQEDRAKIEWLRAAAQEGLDQLDRGEGVEFATVDDLAKHVRSLGEEASQTVDGLARV